MVKITPILQSLLMMQLGVVMDNLNNHNFYKSWDALKVLIEISPDTVQTKMTKQMDVVQAELNVITSDKQQDLIQQRTTQTKRMNLVCAKYTHGLLKQTMKALYEGGYLEFGRKEEAGYA
jgi:hypothetical protein